MIWFAIPLGLVANFVRGGNLSPWVFWSKDDSGWWLSLFLWAAAGFCAGLGWFSLAMPGVLWLWACLPWGHLYTFGNATPVRPWTKFETLLLHWAEGGYMAAVYMRMTLGVGLGFLGLSLVNLVVFSAGGPHLHLGLWIGPLDLALAWALTLGYWVGWKTAPHYATPIGEAIGGVAWGSAIAVLGALS